MEDDEEKNKLTSPSQTFPIALKLSKRNNKAEKKICAMKARNKAKMISGFPSAP